MANVRSIVQRMTGGRWPHQVLRVAPPPPQRRYSSPPDERTIQLQNALSKEIGSSGLSIFSGYVREAYTPELLWPDAYNVYNDMRRRVTTIRALLNAITMLAHQAKWKFEGASDKGVDQEAADFGNSVIADMEESFDHFIQDALTALSFGWSWHEVNFSRRDPNWRPDNGDDEWRPHETDGRIGWRNLAFRQQSSWLRWEADDFTKKVNGMWQVSPPNPIVMIPLKKSIHFTPFRDGDNPEGQALLESSYNAYYYLKNYEIILGVGMERSLVGWPVITFDDKPDDDDLTRVKLMVATLLAGSEKGYLTEPPGIHMRFESIPNHNAPTLLEIMKYYNVAMLQTVLADFIWLGAGARGSWALGQDKSALFIMAVNGILDGLVDTLNARAVKRLYEYNKFPGLVELPRLTHTGVHKPLPLDVLGTFVQTISQLIPLSEDDQINIRLATDGLLAKQPTAQKPKPPVTPPEPQPGANGQNPPPEQPDPAGSMQPAPAPIAPSSLNANPALRAQLDGLVKEIVKARADLTALKAESDLEAERAGWLA